jgi:hypothetical protein
MRARLAILRPTDVQGRLIEIDRLPAKADQFRRTQAVPKGNEQHRRVAVSPTATLCCLNQLLDLAGSQVLAAANLTIAPARWRIARIIDLPIFDGGTPARCNFFIIFKPWPMYYLPINRPLRASVKVINALPYFRIWRAYFRFDNLGLTDVGRCRAPFVVDLKNLAARRQTGFGKLGIELLDCGDDRLVADRDVGIEVSRRHHRQQRDAVAEVCFRRRDNVETG